MSGVQGIPKVRLKSTYLFDDLSDSTTARLTLSLIPGKFCLPKDYLQLVADDAERNSRILLHTPSVTRVPIGGSLAHLSFAALGNLSVLRQ